MESQQTTQLVAEIESSALLAKHKHAQHVAARVWQVIFATVMVALGTVLGYDLGAYLVKNVSGLKSPPYVVTIDPFLFAFLFALIAFLLATAVFNKVILISESLRVMSPSEKVAVFIGLLLGLFMTFLVSQILGGLMVPTRILLTIVIGVSLVFLGVSTMLSMKDEFKSFLPGASIATLSDELGISKLERIKILDTNVIIDGRVSDVCRTGFIEGPIYIPGFVLDEIQHIADSADALKRARGRRGLDILNQMRSELPLIVRSLDSKIDFQGPEEVDAKLVKLAKKLDGAIVTNDFNLNKVAELQGVAVLNINELANALKPVVLPGEEMRVTVIKEGKEMNQGVAYLDDGTMIVIDGGRRHIGETMEVIVSSVLQTVAGKMIFAAIKSHDETANHDDDGPYEPNPRAYSGGRTRRPIR